MIVKNCLLLDIPTIFDCPQHLDNFNISQMQKYTQEQHSKTTLQHPTSQPQMYKLGSQCFTISTQLLGQGGFAKVYKGSIIGDSKTVAIKVCNDLNSAYIEDKIYKSLQGIPNQLKYYGSFFTQEYKPALVFQIHGISLRSYLNRKGGTLEIFETLKIFLGILGCMGELKKLGILHRDLKTDNILIKNHHNSDSQYQIKICDFGLAALNDPKANKLGCTKVGTVYYKSPEAIRFGQYSYSSEIWSLGIIMYEMLYGVFPLEKQFYKNQQQLYSKLISSKIKFGNVPPQLALLGERCLNPNSAKRIILEQLQQQVENLIFQEKEKSRKQLITFISSRQNQKLTEGLLLLFKHLKLRIQELGNMTNIQKKITEMSQYFTTQLNPSNVTNFINQIDASLLNEYLKKMNIILKYTKRKQQIMFNLKEFLVMEVLTALINAVQLCQNGQYEDAQKLIEEFSVKNQKTMNKTEICERIFHNFVHCH